MKGMLTPSNWVCRQADYYEWPQVVECWYGYQIGTHENENIVEQFSRPTSAFTAWGAWRDHQLDTALLLSPCMPCVHAWPIRSVLADRPQCLHVATQLWAKVAVHFGEMGFSFLQSLIRTEMIRDIEMMKHVGMLELTSIQQYENMLERLTLGSEKIVLLQSSETEYPDFRRILLSTFVDTLDVPELNALAGEASTGWEYKSDNLRRYLIFNEGVCCGVAVLEVFGEDASLRYIGVKREYRGRGLAQEALLQLLQLARQLNCKRVQVRVDARNTPALRLYQAAGFTKLDEEVLLYHPLTS